MTKIGVISDTHGILDQKFLDFFEGCDQIWHAGDIGSPDIITDLKSLFPVVHAVYGNIDSWELRTELPETDIFKVEELTVILRHICGKPLYYNKQTQQLIEQHKPQILVCGHSHILKVQYDKKHNLLHINPGAAGISGFHKVRTAIRFIIDGKNISDLKVFELQR